MGRCKLSNHLVQTSSCITTKIFVMCESSLRWQGTNIGEILCVDIQGRLSCTREKPFLARLPSLGGRVVTGAIHRRNSLLRGGRQMWVAEAGRLVGESSPTSLAVESSRSDSCWRLGQIVRSSRLWKRRTSP
ncbi:hypothetical protein PAXRUDRAFT_823349 [Paxillus rubicundulus Ve08.2h10]|uniref:Uncharacterized protein n=1 Tax=Paxillus rubicundulus Ve08.2h10 TaxID=930991 RepID=A0A0D0EC83_9AGAM|nr:hypothetical protein PAXRUDRAFT_823349 [Paxillus rubicundulus Ve08.2h10]